MHIDGGAVLQGILLLVVAWVGAGVREANRKLTAMGERLAGIEAWRVTHEAVNDQRHRENLEALERLREDQRKLCRYPDCPAGRKEQQP